MNVNEAARGGTVEQRTIEEIESLQKERLFSDFGPNRAAKVRTVRSETIPRPTEHSHPTRKLDALVLAFDGPFSFVLRLSLPTAGN